MAPPVPAAVGCYTPPGGLGRSGGGPAVRCRGEVRAEVKSLVRCESYHSWALFVLVTGLRLRGPPGRSALNSSKLADWPLPPLPALP